MFLTTSVDIDKKRLEQDARDSEHSEAYIPMWEQGRIRIGIGARYISPKKTTFFIEVILPICNGSQIDLNTLQKKFKLLKKLEEEGFSITCQDDMSFCCEFVTLINDIENN